MDTVTKAEYKRRKLAYEGAARTWNDWARLVAEDVFTGRNDADRIERARAAMADYERATERLREALS